MLWCASPPPGAKIRGHGMNCSFPNRNPSVVVYGLQIEIEMCVYPHVVMENYASQNATPEPINISLIHFNDISSSTTLVRKEDGILKIVQVKGICILGKV